MGLHPWFVTEERLSRLGELEAARERGAAAIGEIGLDGKTDVPMDLQRRAFRRQAAIAHDIGLPVVIHSRNAFDVLQPELRELGPFEAGGLLHAFSGSLELAEEFLDLGFSFSMGRSLTYRNSTKRAKVLERVFPERLLLETDSPDMPPVEVEQGPNVPANLVYCLTAASETLGMGPEAVAEATTANAERLFRLED
jgi:TatD DNase family protein